MPEQDIASLISEHRILLEEAVREVIRRYPQSLSPSENFSKHIFSSEQLKNIIDTVLAEAWQQSAMVVITLCDEKGECVLTYRMPGTSAEDIDVAGRAAEAAVSFAKENKQIIDPTLHNVIGGIDTSRGGCVVYCAGKVIGGIGISGASAEKNHLIALRAVDSLKSGSQK
ncbi:GlcG/HbpS family heme-binding protein [Klebsiella variicola]|uniref:GlcG/HbpS family heme-binding protein n=1 Tax=Klebsiella variicola TaxID=244366 RepID=UPI0012AB461E|nr:heme-binding protein [Klebsiella variicola]MCS5939783.1 heme-binding protein [Klebsiella variicola subsp. variicola]